jgi:hypothetical protein
VGNDLRVIILRVLICEYWFAGNYLQVMLLRVIICDLWVNIFVGCFLRCTALALRRHVPSSSSCCACLSLYLLFLQCCCDRGLSLHASLDVLFLRCGRMRCILLYGACVCSNRVETLLCPCRRHSILSSAGNQWLPCVMIQYSHTRMAPIGQFLLPDQCFLNK